MTDAGRPRFDSAAVARDARAHGLVVVAGAGLSMGPPSSLPGWTEINDAFLENLAVCIGGHTDGEIGGDMLQFVLERRATAGVAQPDLQAQLAEESLGEHYFALFGPLDIETWNDGHAAIAALAAGGAPARDRHDQLRPAARARPRRGRSPNAGLLRARGLRAAAR